MVTFQEQERLLENQHFRSAVIETGAALEDAMGKAYQDIFLKLDIQAREAVLIVEKEVGEGKPIGDLGLGQLLVYLQDVTSSIRLHRLEKQNLEHSTRVT